MSRMVNVLRQLCNATTILAGIWNFGSQIDKGYDPWKSCPNTLSYAFSETREKAGNDALFDQPGKYSCRGKEYLSARYSTPTCSFLPLSYTLQVLSTKSSTASRHSETRSDAHETQLTTSSKSASTSPHRTLGKAKDDPTSVVKKGSATSHKDHVDAKPLKRIVYIGDSLVTETYLAAKCLLEHHHLTSYIDVSYSGEVFLRDDIPCDPMCINNATMYLPYQGQLRNPCWACADGRLRTWAEFVKRPSSWVNRVPNDTIAVVMGGGTWYNGYKGLIDPSAAYYDTLSKLRPILKEWITDRGITVFWQGLVPTIPEQLVSLNVTELYGWAYFDEKDLMAKTMLEPIGVQFVNVSALTRERKRMDIKLNADPIHWCNPGVHSIPAFLNHVYFHLLASRLVPDGHT